MEKRPTLPAEKIITTWKYWDDHGHPPYDNMAIDEVLLGYCFDSGLPMLRTYLWDRAAVSIGYFQKYDAIGDPSHRYIVRRPTGGGIVFHGNDLSYTVAVPRKHQFFELDRMTSYRKFSKGIQKALTRVGIFANLAIDQKPSLNSKSESFCFRNPVTHDVMYENEKIAGSAQKRNHLGLLHQGTIFLGKTPLRDHFDNFSVSLVKAFQTIIGCSFTEFEPDTTFFLKAKKISVEKYQSEAWNQKR